MSGGGDVFINDEDLYGDDGLDADIYGDPDLASAKYKPELPPEVAITMDSLYVSDEIATRPWYAGRIDRAEAEKRIKSGTCAGNFLIRQKGTDGNTFVHSYLSMTRMTIIHNMIEFKPDGSCEVDGKPWVHQKKPKLAEVVDVMLQIRRARKGVTAAAEVHPAFSEAVLKLWPRISPHGMDRSQANKAVVQMRPGGFLVVSMPNPNLFLLVIKTEDGCYEASIVKSPQGYYLRFSELIAPTLPELVAQIAVNERAAFMAGIPQRLEIDEVGSQQAPQPPRPQAKRAPLPPPVVDDVYNDLPGEEEELVYEDVDDDGGAPHTGGEELHPTYGDDAYGTVEQAGGGAPPPPRPPKKGPVEEEVLYGD